MLYEAVLYGGPVAGRRYSINYITKKFYCPYFDHEGVHRLYYELIDYNKEKGVLIYLYIDSDEI